MAREEIERPLVLSVLDRLLDQDPRNRNEVPLSRAQSLRALKDAVRRDIEWLLNTRCNPETPPEHARQVRRSLYCFGLPDISSLSGDAPDDRTRLRAMIEAAIAMFESRLSHVVVSELPLEREGSRTLRFSIRAMLRTDPSPEPVVFDTMLDLANREYAVRAQ